MSRDNETITIGSYEPRIGWLRKARNYTGAVLGVQLFYDFLAHWLILSDVFIVPESVSYGSIRYEVFWTTYWGAAILMFLFTAYTTHLLEQNDDG